MKQHHLFLFRITVWLTWMLAALGILLYARHAWLVGARLHAGDAHDGLWTMLAWDAVYLLAAGLTLGAATGALMWRAWARPLLRWIAFALALYSLVTAVTVFMDWQYFQHASESLMAQARHADMIRELVRQKNHAIELALTMKVLMTAALAWLGWQLGAAPLVERFGAHAA